jgi:hypothetical protein
LGVERGGGSVVGVLGKSKLAKPLTMVAGFLGAPTVPEGSIYDVIAHSDAAQFDAR